MTSIIYSEDARFSDSVVHITWRAFATDYVQGLLPLPYRTTLPGVVVIAKGNRYNGVEAK